MKKSVVFFLSGLSFLGVSLSSGVIAGEGDATESSSNSSTGVMSGFEQAAEDAAARQDEENAQALEAMAGGMAGSEPAVPVTIQFHVPVSVSNLPPEITRIGVRCLVRVPRGNATRTVFGSARNGGRTILLSVPVSVPFSDVINNRIHGNYDCRILIQAGNETPVSLSDIEKTIELDGSQQIVKVRGSF